MPHRKEISNTAKRYSLIKEQLIADPGARSLGQTLKHLYGFSINEKNVRLEDLLLQLKTAETKLANN